MRGAKLVLGLILAVLTFQGCVRFTGGAGYWHTGPEGEVQNKSVGFDTKSLVPGSQASGTVS